MRKVNFRSFLKKVSIAVFTCGLIVSTAIPCNAAWRSTYTVKKNGHNLMAKADLPYFSDWDGGGDWKSQSYYGKKVRLTNSWQFYSVGGSVNWNGVGLSGSGSNNGGSHSSRGTTNVVNASGRVYSTGLCLYVGMISTASFSSGNSFYSVSTKI